MLQRIFGRKWPAPVAEPMTPFYVAGGVIFYGVYSLSNFLANTEEYRNDPRNPNARANPPGKAGH
ncbi:ATP synthase j chain-domain-containing protein [Tuber borchii]|uniref:ATP synthase j chain-domain-containing protein n=1 Tax=Tuber borchii TaxID=42251 RepID=A0A2T6ZJK6_TUBBO|nr:ATP synthase j chain-domain-containing protein [Tuber borchii]